MDHDVRIDTNQLISELISESLGDTWKLELAATGKKFSYASKRDGNRSWADKMAKKLVKDSIEDYEFIGIFSEGESSEGPILTGVVYHCTEFYLKKSPYMYFEKKDACKIVFKTKKPTEYIEG
tara:strand:+ start:22625 stop:22993 length:369 start_codon:yes stop_codon:yes gene_type:complete